MEIETQQRAAIATKNTKKHERTKRRRSSMLIRIFVLSCAFLWPFRGLESYIVTSAHRARMFATSCELQAWPALLRPALPMHVGRPTGARTHWHLRPNCRTLAAQASIGSASKDLARNNCRVFRPLTLPFPTDGRGNKEVISSAILSRPGRFVFPRSPSACKLPAWFAPRITTRYDGTAVSDGRFSLHVF